MRVELCRVRECSRPGDDGDEDDYGEELVVRWPSAPVLEELTLRLVLPKYMDQDLIGRDVMLNPKPRTSPQPTSSYPPSTSTTIPVLLPSSSENSDSDDNDTSVPASSPLSASFVSEPGHGTSAGRGMHCPPLRTLAFSTRKRGDPDLCGFDPTLAPETVREFVQWQLWRTSEASQAQCDGANNEGGPPLTLQLNGVALYEGNVGEVVKLLEVVNEVRIGEGHVSGDCALAHLLEW